MRGTYTAPYRISGLSAAKTLMYMTVAAAKNVRTLSVSVTNESNETNEQLIVCIQQISSLGTPTATAVTPSPHEAGDQSATTTVKANVTASEPSFSSNTALGEEGFSSLGGFYFDPTPEERPVFGAASNWGLRCLNAPTSFDAVIRWTFTEEG